MHFFKEEGGNLPALMAESIELEWGGDHVFGDCDDYHFCDGKGKKS